MAGDDKNTGGEAFCTGPPVIVKVIVTSLSITPIFVLSATFTLIISC